MANSVLKEKLDRINKMTAVEDMAVALRNLIGDIDDTDAIDTILAITPAFQVQEDILGKALQPDSLGSIGMALCQIDDFNQAYYYQDAYGHYHNLSRNQVELIIEDVFHYTED